MSADQYPTKCLVERLFDSALSILAIAFLITAIIIGLTSEILEHRLVNGLGMGASAIGAFLEYRQKVRYERNHIEESLLSGALSAKYLNGVAKLRHRLVAANILIVVVGIWVSGYGVVWYAP